MVSLRKIAYGKPKYIKSYGPTWNRLTDVGLNIRRTFTVRPLLFGWEKGKR